MTSMDPPQEPSKPGLETDAELAASAANAVEQWRTYQNAYTLYQQQYTAYQEYMHKQATLTTYEEQQAAYNQYLEAHNNYQKQLEQYEYQKGYQDCYMGVPNAAPGIYPAVCYPPQATTVSAPVFTTPLVNVDPFYNRGNDHQRPPSSIKRRSEASANKSKIYTTTTYYANPDDEELFPADLKKLFEPLNCSLCKCRMNSHISANVHYHSMVHEKKIVQWLKEWCERTKTPMPHRTKRRPSPIEPVGPNSLHCEACDLPLTSIQHANQHYTGKRHQMVVRGKKNPAGKGFYKADGNWKRSLTTPDEHPERFGIGASFANQADHYSAKDIKRMRLEPPPSPPPGVKEIMENVLGTTGNGASNETYPIAATVSQPQMMTLPVPYIPTTLVSPYAPTAVMAADYSQPPPVLVEPYTAPTKTKSARKPKLVAEASTTADSLQSEILKKESADCVDESGVFCKVCQIAVTSATVMETHLKGTKHLKKLKSVGRLPPANKTGAPAQSILSILHKQVKQNDWSLYRMPSGKFYCKSCNIILADEKLFSQHWYGKKHKLKVKQEMEELTGTTTKAAFYPKRQHRKDRPMPPQQLF
ncbi:uncharacterized protein LOC129723292 [Wyeomyia smithii]|uniref:uncharacterized protein LOC129723292 n=1 Tax=Wyeomyia smithii TaxID=174621 RepID=UPI002467ED7D|nr:uncharacterized protein LOC129723292 [Wyeomyia smithii]